MRRLSRDLLCLPTKVCSTIGEVGGGRPLDTPERRPEPAVRLAAEPE